MDGVKWGKPVAKAKGQRAHGVTFAPVRAKFARITQTDAVDTGPNWAISNLHVYEAGGGK